MPSTGRQSGHWGSKARRGWGRRGDPGALTCPPHLGAALRPAGVSGRPLREQHPASHSPPRRCPSSSQSPTCPGLHQPLLQSLIHCGNRTPKQRLQRAHGAISGKALGPQAHAHPAALLPAGLGLRRHPEVPPGLLCPWPVIIPYGPSVPPRGQEWALPAYQGLCPEQVQQPPTPSRSQPGAHGALVPNGSGIHAPAGGPRTCA